MRILAIDPGTKTTGYCGMEIDEEDGRIEIVFAECHNAEKMTHRFPTMLLNYDELTTRLHAHGVNLNRLIEIMKPDVVVAESPFFNPRRPTSAEPLARMKQVITEVVANNGVELVWIAPQQMKRVVGANVKNSSKDNVREAIEKLIEEEELCFSRDCEQQHLDQVVEHVVDAIGIGYTFAANERTKWKTCLNF